MFNKYYQDELAYLRELGREYADARPEAARFLGEAGSDPDVERLLEGFAFLTGRVRQKLDDELPELTRSMMELFFPQFLRPIPSMAIVQAEPKDGMDSAGASVPAGSFLDSVEQDGHRCRFRTTSAMTPVPARVQTLEFHDVAPGSLRLSIAPLRGYDLSAVAGKPLRLHLAGDPVVTRALYLCLCHLVESISVGGVPCPQARIVPANLGSDDGMLPAPSGAFDGLRLVQEYFAFPSRFMFVELAGLDLSSVSSVVDIEIRFRRVPEDMPPVTTQNVQLNCVPVVNLFDHDADPIRTEPDRAEYKLRPSGGNTGKFEVYSVSRVEGSIRGTSEVVAFQPLYSFHRTDASAGRFYDVRAMDSTQYDGEDHFLVVGGGGEDEVVTLSMDTVCTNRREADRLGLGDIGKPAGRTPLAFEYRNITRPTATIAAPTGDDIYWRLLANLSLNYRSLADLETLRALLRLYDFRSREDRQAQRQLDNRMGALQSVTSQRATAMLDGVPVRGLEVVLTIDEERFGGEGEVYLFGTVFRELLAQYATINSFTRLRIELAKSADTMRWPARLGAGDLL